MQRYIVKRLLLAFPTVFGLTVLIFFTLRVMPGDVALTILGEDTQVDHARLAEIRQELGLDQPIYVQYAQWVWSIIRLDPGKSYGSEYPIAKRLATAIPVTFNLALYTMVLTLIVAIPLGAVSALRQDGWLDYLCRAAALVGLSTPGFWVGIMVIMFLAFYVGWMPQLQLAGFFEDPIKNFTQLFWPALVIAIAQTAVITRMTRSTLLEVLREDYVRTARAKGLRERSVVIGHALKNAMLPVVTLIGLEFAGLMNGAVITETVFAIPGLGSTLIQGINAKDFPLIQATVLFIGLIVVLVNMIVDLSYAWLDPRIKYR
jgi:peptide/nickel transport system permease protein